MPSDRLTADRRLPLLMYHECDFLEFRTVPLFLGFAQAGPRGSDDMIESLHLCE
ncbi:hypothetical protein Salmuc_02085 [Salipiger mucosus DSM 16094]|uniref:Uncharacterized protein n=1 Tax=Salipiger mucosus DSM 16094 TaxID=1123237 RepID=S9QV82_9RHOB|nr:hypothetical protein Salmuc_02085 [Salipiger mucosus DSM 16094]